MDAKPLTYLACPYSDPLPIVRSSRADEADRALAWLMRNGETAVFSPISHSHRAATFQDLPTEYRFWQETCEVFLSVSHRLIVLAIDGWRRSVGVNEEYRLARQLNIECFKMVPTGDGEYMLLPLTDRMLLAEAN